MASVTRQDIPQVAAFMQDFWTLVKKYWVPEDTAEYWNSLIDKCSELTRKYQNEQFVVDMLVVFVDSQQNKIKTVPEKA